MRVQPLLLMTVGGDVFVRPTESTVRSAVFVGQTGTCGRQRAATVSLTKVSRTPSAKRSTSYLLAPSEERV